MNKWIELKDDDDNINTININEIAYFKDRGDYNGHCTLVGLKNGALFAFDITYKKFKCLLKELQV